MSTRKTRNQKSSSTAASVETTTGVQEGVVATTSATSSPSGSSVPDGTISQNTPQSGGDAAGEAPANPVQPQANFAPTEVIPAEAKNQTPTPVVEASTSGTISDASQGAAEGAGANAGSDLSEFTVAEILELAGAANVMQLLVFAELGKHINAIAELNGMENAEVTARLGLIEDASGAESFEEAMKRPVSGAVRVKAKRDGFRRAGVEHSKAGQTFEAGELTVEQIAAFVEDPAITVEYL